MEPVEIYKLERYKTAFVDYEAATRKFHEGVLALALEHCATDVPLHALTHELDVRHKYFVECANHLVRIVST